MSSGAISPQQAKAEADIDDLIADCYHSPLDGQHAVPALRKAISKGHGVGGSVMIAWLTTWIMATRPHAQGTVTANTSTQLETKTWPTITRWLKLPELAES